MYLILIRKINMENIQIFIFIHSQLFLFHMHISIVLFAYLFVIIHSQVTPNKTPYNTLMNCLTYLCPTETKVCTNSVNCTTTIYNCEPKYRYTNIWSNWFSCTSSNVAALVLVKCRYAPLCGLRYKQSYGVTSMRNYLNDTSMQEKFLAMTKLPRVWENSTQYALDENCVASTCETQTIYCLLNGQCGFLYSLCWPSSFTDQQFADCIRSMAVYSYYLANLLACWSSNCMY